MTISTNQVEVLRAGGAALVKEAGQIIAKIAMKPGTSKGDFLSFTAWLDHHGKLLSDAEQTEDGRFVAVAQFDDGMDYLAFLVITGLCQLSQV